EVDAEALLRRGRKWTRTSHQDQKRKNQRESDLPLMNANIANNLDNDQATKTLNRVIKKMDFLNMRVIGQFNLGFIIAMLNEDDLFIVDQHASDEKYNFETLQLTTQIKGQKLIHPRAVELTASEELVAMDNIDILKANGFDIQVDENAPPTQKIKIISQPVSKNTMFNMKDFEELVFLLSERPGEMVRCSKARTMFASRACRKSLISNKLFPVIHWKFINCPHSYLLQQIVQNMSKIDQPWVSIKHSTPLFVHKLNSEHHLSVTELSSRTADNATFIGYVTS
ncbi:hypothetical protein INT43_002470, partial [Umbelopsis isabellina]